MAQYGVIYRMEFRDYKELLWRVDFRLKNAGDSDSPLMLVYGGASPVVIEWVNSGEDKFASIITSKASITYYCKEDSDPAPEVFIDIEDDQWMVDIYKLSNNITPTLFWRGLVRPDSNKYPWVSRPFPFTINAVDFTFSKGQIIDLNRDGVFLYDYITLGDFFNRALFLSVGYDDPTLKILFTKTPAVIGGQLLTEGIYIHTDAFYDFTDGAKFCYNCLEQLLSSIGARILFSAGTYWIQRVQDIGTPVQEVIVLSPDDVSGTIEPNLDIFQSLGNSPSDTVIYLDKSQYLTVNPGLKQQTIKFMFQAINGLHNFDWSQWDGTNFAEWVKSTVDPPNITRVGSGSLEDPFKCRFTYSAGDPTLSQMIDNGNIGGSTVSFIGDGYMQIQIKVSASFRTVSGENLSNVKSIGVALISSNPGTGAFYLSTDGTWIPVDEAPPENNYPITINPKVQTGSMDFTSVLSPYKPGEPFGFSIMFKNIVPEDDLPPGSQVYVDIWPIKIAYSNTSYEGVTEKIVNEKRYSFVPDDKERFFLDSATTGLSNNFYYDNSGTMTILPSNNWDGKDIDERLLRGELDQQHKPGYSFDGDVMSNELSFHHAITLTDFGNKPMMMIRDKYDVVKCRHSIFATEIMPEDSGIGTYTVTPITKSR